MLGCRYGPTHHDPYVPPKSIEEGTPLPFYMYIIGIFPGFVRHLDRVSGGFGGIWGYCLANTTRILSVCYVLLIVCINHLSIPMCDSAGVALRRDDNVKAKSCPSKGPGKASRALEA